MSMCVCTCVCTCRLFENMASTLISTHLSTNATSRMTNWLNMCGPNKKQVALAKGPLVCVRVCLCMCICVMCLPVCMCIHMSEYGCACTRTPMFAYGCVLPFVLACFLVFKNVCVADGHRCTLQDAHTHTHTLSLTHTHAHTHKHTHIYYAPTFPRGAREH